MSPARVRTDYDRQYRSLNRERVRDKGRRFHHENPGKSREYMLRSSYGMSGAEWDRLFAEQNCRCAACNRVDHGGRGWATDHDHTTSKVRGILCHKCNLSLGHADDSLIRLRQLVSYMERYS